MTILRSFPWRAPSKSSRSVDRRLATEPASSPPRLVLSPHAGVLGTAAADAAMMLFAAGGMILDSEFELVLSKIERAMLGANVKLEKS